MNEVMIKEFEALANQSKNTEGNSFRVRSHFKVLKILKELDFEIENTDQVKDIKGIGKNTLARIKEVLENGYLKGIQKSDEIQDKMKTLKDLERITGIGPVKAKKLFDKNLSLEKILEEYHTGNLSEKFTNHQLLGIKHFHDLEKRIPYEEIQLIDNFMKTEIQKFTNKVEHIICGSYRRKAPTSGDIDILFYSKNAKECEESKTFLPKFLNYLNTSKFLVDHLTSLDSNTKYMGMCKFDNNPVRRIDIRYIPQSSLGAAKLYFTGSGDFNKNMRTFAITKGYTINEYGIYNLKEDKTKGTKMKTKTEEDIFNVLGLDYIEPEMRLPSFTFDK